MWFYFIFLFIFFFPFPHHIVTQYCWNKNVWINGVHNVFPKRPPKVTTFYIYIYFSFHYFFLSLSRSISISLSLFFFFSSCEAYFSVVLFWSEPDAQLNQPRCSGCRVWSKVAGLWWWDSCTSAQSSLRGMSTGTQALTVVSQAVLLLSRTPSFVGAAIVTLAAFRGYGSGTRHGNNLLLLLHPHNCK